MVIKGLYDFYLLSKLNPIAAKGTGIISYKKSFNTYCFFVSSAFNNAKSISFTENLSAGRFQRQFDYLLNHPKISGLYQIFVVYSLRIPIILNTIITAPFSKQSRRYFNKKAGSSSALKKYFKNLKEEI